MILKKEPNCAADILVNIYISIAYDQSIGQPKMLMQKALIVVESYIF